MKRNRQKYNILHNLHTMKASCRPLWSSDCIQDNVLSLYQWGVAASMVGCLPGGRRPTPFVWVLDEGPNGPTGRWAA